MISLESNKNPPSQVDDKPFAPLPSKIEEDMGKLDLYDPKQESKKVHLHKVIYENIKKNMP